MKQVTNDGSLTAKAAEALRAAILSGELAAGELHSVHDLADTLGVSRTPVREALIQLAGKGMVRFERNRGVRILQTTAHDLEEVFELRLLLEVPAARLAAARMDRADVARLGELLAGMFDAAEAGDEARLMRDDRRFHGVILEASGNRRLAGFVDSLRDLVLTHGVSTAGTSRTLSDIAAEHEPILACIRAGDADAAAQALRDHLMKTATLLLRHEFGISAQAVQDFTDGARIVPAG